MNLTNNIDSNAKSHKVKKNSLSLSLSIYIFMMHTVTDSRWLVQTFFLAMEYLPCTQQTLESPSGRGHKVACRPAVSWCLEMRWPRHSQLQPCTDRAQAAPQRYHIPCLREPDIAANMHAAGALLPTLCLVFLIIISIPLHESLWLFWWHKLKLYFSLSRHATPTQFNYFFAGFYPRSRAQWGRKVPLWHLSPTQ